jgi:type IV pilus assembly protein PilQ
MKNYFSQSLFYRLFIPLLFIFGLFSTGVSFAQGNYVKKVDFVHSRDFSNLIIELSSEAVAERFHNKDDKQILVDIKNVKADNKTVRPIDTSEFSGAAVYVSAYEKPGSPNDLRFAIQLRDNIRSKLKFEGNKIIVQMENRFGVFSERDIEKGNNQLISQDSKALDDDVYGINVPKSKRLEDVLENVTLSGKKKYVGKRISINVKNIAVSDLLKMIADTSGFNIIIDEDAARKPPMTISLTNIPWDEALDTILTLNKLTAQRNANILSITTVEKALKEREDRLNQDKQYQVEEPLVTKIFPISYAKLEDLSKILKDYSTEKRGTITSDDRTNMLIIKDTVEVVEKMKKIIDLLDAATPQVLIEAKIVEANESFEQNVGFGAIQTSYDAFTPAADLGTDSGEFSLNLIPDPSLLGLNISVFKRLKDLNFSLNLMETERKGKIISSPKVITQNKEAAKISTSDSTSYSVTTIQDGVTTQSFQQVSANLTLNVTPQVTNEGSIALEIDVSKSGFTSTPSGGAPPDLATNDIQTNVLVDNGSTVMIGGLYQSSDSEEIRGVPFLKDIPILGWLFRSPYRPVRTKKELIVFITPRVINQEEAGLTNQSTVK